MTGKVGQLPDRVILCDPELEPMPFIVLFVLSVLSDESLGTKCASESLLVIGALTEALNRARTTERTVLFFS